MLKRHRFTSIFLVVVGLTLGASQAGAQAAGWAIRQSAAADLWFHGLAVLGFGAGPSVRAYSPDYVADVTRAKRDRGLFPTELDEKAEELREELLKDPAFQVFHFVPLYFPDAEPVEFLRALRAVAEEKTRDPDLVDRVTRPGVAVVSRVIREGRHRDRLKDFVELLEAEWELFFADYWQELDEAGSQTLSISKRQWVNDFEPALEGFLTSQRMDGGTALVSPALGPDGRMYEGVPASRSDNVVAVGIPATATDDLAIPYSMLRQMCYAAVDDGQNAPGVRRSENAAFNGAIRCGSIVLESYLEDYRSAYDVRYLDLWPGEGPTPPTLATAYPLR